MSDSKTASLHRIDQLPIDASAEIFRHYPAFKFGVTAAVRHYAQLLLPLVQRLIAESKQAGWIITGPGLASQTPAAANLLCWELFDLCNANELSLIDLEYDNEATASIDYAKLDLADRLTQRERLARRLIPNTEFRGRPVLFINDICITGVQQHTMQQYFDRVEAACVTWLYVIVVDPEVGKAKPEIEWEINFAPFEDLLRMVSREEIQFTGKCVLKLMELKVEELDRVLRALSSERRARLLELAARNFEHLDGFKKKLELLRTYAPDNAEGVG